MSHKVFPIDNLPVEELCNKKINPNPLIGKGELGNELHNKMEYSGEETRKYKLVRDLQIFLVLLGYYNHKVDGYFANETEAAVCKFQNNHCDWEGRILDADGLVGPRTADAINRAIKERVFFPGYKTPETVEKTCKRVIQG